MNSKVFEARPGLCVLVRPDPPRFTAISASNELLLLTGLEKEQVAGSSLFDLLKVYPGIHESGEKELSDSLQSVVDSLSTHQLQRKFERSGGDFNFKITNIPVADDSGNLEYIICSLDHITPASQKEKGIKGMEKAYQVFMNAPVIIGILRGPDYVIELANENLLEVWGRTSDVIGKPLLTAIPELEAQGFISLLDQVCTTGEPFYAYEFPITLHRSGKDEVLYFDFIYKPIYEESNTERAGAIISVGHDVTTRVIARQKIQESEAKYRSLFESMDQGFCVVEMIFDEKNKPVDYRFLEVNPVFEKQTGLKNAIGKNALELVPNLEPRWLELYGNVALTGESNRFVEGSEAMGRWFEVYAFSIGQKNSAQVALLFTDITERKKSEEAIRQSEKNLRNTILQAPVAMTILRGPEFIVEIANERMFELWGRGKEDLLNKSIFEGLPEVSDQGYEEILKGVYTTGKTFSALGIPVTVPRNDRIENIYINLLYTPFREVDGTISGIMAIATEVTEQVLARQKIEEVVEERTRELAQANNALVHINQELKRSNVNLEEFAYAASHDLKEPMRKIQLFSDRLLERLQDKLEKEDRNFFDRIIHATKRMNTLIDDLLMYSHVSRGAAITEMVDLNQKVAVVLEDLDLEIEENKAIVNYDNLPTVMGNRRQLQQLFQNLIGNAIKYVNQDQRPEISISSRIIHGTEAPRLPEDKKEQTYYLIEVRDNGIGFEQADADRIFNVFTRLHGNAEFKGTGVGLSIARKVVENHGGYIWAESRVGEGSTFYIMLPVIS